MTLARNANETGHMPVATGMLMNSVGERDKGGGHLGRCVPANAASEARHQCLVDEGQQIVFHQGGTKQTWTKDSQFQTKPPS